MVRIVLFAALAGAALSPLSAADSNAPQEASAPGVEAPKDAAKPKLVCRRDEASMGSRMSARVCKTAAEWKAIADADRAAFTARDKD